MKGRETGAFPIRVLSELTGVPATTLRAWERRYGLLQPGRTPKGHRLYTSTDVETVRRVLQLLASNQSISKAVQVLRGSSAPSGEAASPPHSPWNALRRRLSRAIQGFDERRLDAVYNEALSLYPIDLVSTHLLVPTLRRLGERWSERATGIAEEHFFSAYLRNKIGARMHHSAAQNRGRCLLLACLPGEYHELGVLLFGLSMMARGYRLLYLGSNLPLAQLRPVTKRHELAGVLLSGSAGLLDERLVQELGQLAADLPVPLLLGGSICNGNDTLLTGAGVHPLGAEFAQALERLEARVAVYGAV